MPFAEKKKGRFVNTKGSCGCKAKGKGQRKVEAADKERPRTRRNNPDAVQATINLVPITENNNPIHLPDNAPDTHLDGLVEFLANERKETLFDMSLTLRICVAYHFKQVYQLAPDSEEMPWGGKGGLISKIKKDLNLCPDTRPETIRTIMNSVIEAEQLGIRYVPRDNRSNAGRKSIISTDSQEAQIIADSMESGMSIVCTWGLVNAHRECEELPSVTLSAVYGCVVRLRPKCERVQSAKQGSKNPKDKMSRARFAWCLQLAVRLKIVGPKEIRDILTQRGLITTEDVELPQEYDPDKLSSISEDQFVTWDEVHKKVQPGSDKGTLKSTVKDTVYKFPRDNFGKVDLVNGTYSDEPVSSMKCKYTDEIRLSLGVAVVTPVVDGVEQPKEGRRCTPFVYSGKTLLSIPDYDKKIASEIERVRTMKGGHKNGWVVAPQQTREKTYLDDPVSKLKKVGDTFAKRFNEMMEIRLVRALRFHEESPEEIRGEIRMPKSAFQIVLDQCLSCENMEMPDKVDYRRQPNPYEARYGNNWREVIENSTFLKGYTCITHLIHHMVCETKKVFKGTTHENSCLFYHDALSLMTAKATRQWMKNEGYEKMWILPENNLYEVYGDMKAYIGRPAGNSPELCNLDSNLNQDVHLSVDMNVRYTESYHKDDPRKFSITTPKKGTSAYLRIFDPGPKGIAPTSERILQDTSGVLEAIMIIIEQNGCIVDDMNARKGKRRQTGLTKSSNLGGKRERKQKLDDYGHSFNIHEDAKACKDMKLELSKRLFNGDVGEIKERMKKGDCVYTGTKRSMREEFWENEKKKKLLESSLSGPVTKN